MKVLLLSPYNTPSHQYWCSGLQKQFAQFDWTYLSLPARYFAWRMRGNSLTWAYQQRAALTARYDLIIATSMTDLNGLRGFVPELGSTPTVLYFHENQFSYPQSDMQHSAVHAQMISLYSALCAEKVLFNSCFNRDTFFQGVTALLTKLPDAVPKNLVEHLQGKTQVLPVPILPITVPTQPSQPCKFATGSRSEREPLTIIWNHRWEYDKGPECLLRIIRSMPQNWNIRFHIVGQQFRRVPKAFSQIRADLTSRDWLGQWGYVESRDQYSNLLAASDVVLSTAQHDFQGLAVQEAVLHGCVPLVPNDLSYPEWFAEEYLFEPTNETDAVQKLGLMAQQKPSGQLVERVPDLTWLTWPSMREQYGQIFHIGSQ